MDFDPAADAIRMERVIGPDPMWRALYRLASWPGMDPDSLVRLTWEQIDFDRCTVTLHDCPAIEISAMTMSALRNWRASPFSRKATHWVFIDGDGAPLTLDLWEAKHAELSALP